MNNQTTNMMELVDELTEQSGAVLTFLYTKGEMNDRALARVTVARNKLQAIADQIERTEQQRDKLLELLKQNREFLLVSSQGRCILNEGEQIEKIDKLIAECEGKDE